MVKNFLSLLGIVTLLVFSFFYTEQTIMVVKDMDETMIELKSKSKSYNKKAINGVIANNTLIPGISGKEVNINKSYVKIKEYGKFESNLLVYDEVIPKISINKNYDKFIISGNKDKRMVSLIFLVRENDDIEKIVSILKDKDVKVTFFIDGNWLESNVEQLSHLIKLGHTIGNLSYNEDYSDSSFVWVDTIITRIGKQNRSYCYSENKNIEVINVCKLYKDITINPNIILNNNGLTTLKKKLISGSMISMDINEKTENELGTYINYIRSKGYKLENIQNHLEE